jgi:uncharacterized protein (DUF58 family)
MRREPRAERREARFRWSRVLWSLVAPQRSVRTVPTIAGVLLIGLAIGIGTAAYNAASNILFITLSLLLGCLILSGVLAWLNFRGVSWALRVPPALRAGHDVAIGLDLTNAKRTLPTHALWFDLAARRLEERPPARPESTLTGRGIDVRAALAQADAAEARTRIFLHGRLAAGEERALAWTFRPPRRGRLRIEVGQVGSLFPFGFLQKQLAAGVAEEVRVWPETIAYRRLPAPASRSSLGGERVARAGGGTDLLALRRYEAGDSHRLIHWKASARTGQLVVRQFAAEGAERLALRLSTAAVDWPEPETFERAVRLAATLAEDLFRADRLAAVALDGEWPQPVRRLGDLEAWLDRLAVIERRPEPLPPAAAGVFRGEPDTITLAADGPHHVAARLHGETLALA